MQAQGGCSQVDYDADSPSEKSGSRGRANSVSSCLDDRGAGVSNANPDFRVLEGQEKGGRTTREEDAEREACRRERDEVENSPQLPKGSPEDPDPARDTGERSSPEASVETPKRRHVPGGAWLSKEECSVAQVTQLVAGTTMNEFME
ncbi:hypothetical protein NDU88_005904 [Pleurodeles waltl]|uniref:Uncharacterized protein n=1 Tax=Pleurodeles waltl TaxID=8319 RepID=A0AAV7PPV8_PLEWA|nr:hypothetical protein NDU88_005904 [Pleurodeles waltl]